MNKIAFGSNCFAMGFIGAMLFNGIVDGNLNALKIFALIILIVANLICAIQQSKMLHE